MAEALRHTPLYETHLSLGARMVPFAGWEMPVQYKGIVAEAKAVRAGAGLFDVSHMARFDIRGPQAPQLMDWVVTASAIDLRPGRARYAMVCNEQGGIIDDTVFYRQGEDRYLFVCNASNRQRVLSWLHHWAGERFPQTTIEDRTESTAMIAAQGPASAKILETLCEPSPSGMRPFSAMEVEASSFPALIGRTGYTGEDGFELIVAAADAPGLWEALMARGAVSCGLGARDMLRLEAGLALHGNDIDGSTTPLEAGLERFVRLDKEFVGVEPLRRQKETGPKVRLVGLAVQGRSIARAGYPVLDEGAQIGRVTSGTHSPTLDRTIAMGYVTLEFANPGRKVRVDIRGRLTEAEVVPLPFYSRDITR